MTRIGTNIGIDYTITGVIERGEYGIAVGFQKFGEKIKWCTWEYRVESTNDYYYGHYMMPDESTAWADAISRSNLP